MKRNCIRQRRFGRSLRIVLLYGFLPLAPRSSRANINGCQPHAYNIQAGTCIIWKLLLAFLGCVRQWRPEEPLEAARPKQTGPSRREQLECKSTSGRGQRQRHQVLVFKHVTLPFSQRHQLDRRGSARTALGEPYSNRAQCRNSRALTPKVVATSLTFLIIFLRMSLRGRSC